MISCPVFQLRAVAWHPKRFSGAVPEHVIALTPSGTQT